MERITATYYIETPFAPEKAAAVLAGEQSSGTCVPVPGETEELKQRFAAKVESIELLETGHEPAVPEVAAPLEQFQARSQPYHYSFYIVPFNSKTKDPGARVQEIKFK